MTAVRLVLARHGQTDANVTHALDSRPPGAPLNANGLSQAAALGRRLAGEPVTAVYASRATRAQQTAAPIAAAHGLDVVVIDDVHEVFIGDHEGASVESARDLFVGVSDAWRNGDLDARMPGGESARELHERFIPAVEKLVEGATDTVVVASHGAAIRLAAVAMLDNTVPGQYLDNTALVILRAEPSGWVLEHWDPAPSTDRDAPAGDPIGPA
ncbi:histidine phosphatase family protein [Pseudonocardia sp. GCM10023141]|uniref:histidine phosphatase family protein n=1 Tax=Pseudonocardia sp. GCM10023141 TaxID=3252653 RepID=UPI003609909B